MLATGEVQISGYGITMEFFSFLFISIFLASIIFIISFPFAITYLVSNLDDENFVVHDIIITLKKLCPVNTANRWKLLPQNSCLSRCWGKWVKFPGFQTIKLYGTVCAVPCSSMYAFSLIADVSKLGEWELLPPSQSLSSKPFSDVMLRRDKSMLADQVVGIQRGTDVQSYIAMYRFMSLPGKTVKWILFWNAKTTEFMFFLIQPAVSKTVESQCLITHIFGTKQTSYPAMSVTQKLRNIQDFLVLSQLHVVASKYTAAVPAISAAQAQARKSKTKAQLDDQHVDSENLNSSCQYRFVLVPIHSETKFLLKKIKGFRLAVEKDSVKHEQEKQAKKFQEPLHNTEADKKRKESISDSGVSSKQLRKCVSALELGAKSDNEKLVPDGRRKSSYIIEEKVHLNVNQEGISEKVLPPTKTTRSSSESQQEPFCSFHKTPLCSDSTEHHIDEDSFINLHVIHEQLPEENVSEENADSLTEDRSDIFCSSTSDFELVDTSQQFEDYKLADFLTQGNYGASELQAEMILASHFDKLSFDARNSGGWMLSSTYKGITVLSKTTAGQFTKIISYLCQIELPVNYKDVWKCVKNPRFRFICDETVKTVKIVERISNSQKLVHVYHETSGFLKKECIDFCLLQTEREEPSHLYSSFHSIEYEKCPLMTSVCRGILRPSGWVVENLEPRRCKVTHLLQVIVSSTDSLYINELNNLVPLAMHNLKNYTASKPK